MKQNRILIRKLALLGCVLAMISLILSWRIPLFRILMAMISPILSWRIPLFRILMALVAVWAGIRLTQSSPEAEDEEKDGAQRFHYAFSHGLVDLTDSGRLPEAADIRCAFGQVTVRLPVDTDVTIHVGSLMGNVTLPDRQSMVAGQETCRCGSRDPRAPKLDIHAHCLMGNLSFVMG